MCACSQVCVWVCCTCAFMLYYTLPMCSEGRSGFASRFTTVELTDIKPAGIEEDDWHVFWPDPCPTQPTPNTPASISNTHTHTRPENSFSEEASFFPPPVVYWKGNFDHEARTHTPHKYSLFPAQTCPPMAPFSYCQKCTAAQPLDAEEETFLADSSGCFPHVRTLMQSYCNSLKPETTKTAAFPVALWEVILLCRFSEDNRHKVPFYGYMNSPEQSPGRGMGRDTRL